MTRIFPDAGLIQAALGNVRVICESGQRGSGSTAHASRCRNVAALLLNARHATAAQPGFVTICGASGIALLFLPIAPANRRAMRLALSILLQAVQIYRGVYMERAPPKEASNTVSSRQARSPKWVPGRFGNSLARWGPVP